MQYDPLPHRVSATPAAASTPPPSSPRRVLRWTWPVALALALGAAGGIAVAAAIHMPKVDALASFTPSLGSQLYDDHGHSYRSFARERRVMLKAEEIPPLVQKAVLASEDSNFFRHGGIDAMGILRSAVTDLRQGKIVQGASTITMQLARTLFLNRDKTWHRKIEEALTAVELEKTYSKQQILTLYLNLVNFGHGNYGIEAAARFYFSKPAKDLTLAETATLVGIIPAPSRFSPYNTPEIVLRQRDRVLRRMLDNRAITPADYQAAAAQPLLVASQQPQDNFAAYFAEDVRKYLEATYGATSLYEGGLQVRTTLDPAIQDAAQRAVQSWLLKVDHRRGWRGPIASLTGDLEKQTLPTWNGKPVAERWYQGIVLTADKTAARVKIAKEVFVLGREGIAWTGKTAPSDVLKPGAVAWFRLGPPEVKPEKGKDGKLKPAPPAPAPDKAAEAKLVLYLEQEPRMEASAVVLESKTGAIRAMVGGWDFERNKFNRITQARRQVGSAFKPFVYGAAIEQGWTPADTLLDAPTAFLGGDGKLSYHPQNYYHKHYGIVTLRRALEHSINVPAVKLFELVGGKRVIDFAHRLGLQTPMPAYPSMALGSADLLPIEMASAYATIANQGVYVQPYLIDRITSPDGQVMEQRFPTSRTVTSPPVAYVLTHMMEGVIDHGTGYELHTLDIDIAGKTGTTDDFSDAWFVGFTPRYTILTWIGYDVKKSLGAGMSGAVAALPMWKAIAEDGLAKGWLTKGERFTVPPGVVLKDVEYYTGLLPGQGSDRNLQEAFVAGTEPNRQYNNRWQTITSLPWYQQRAFYIPKEGESMAPGAPGAPAPGQPTTAAPRLGAEGQIVGEGDAGTVVPPPQR